MKKKILSIALVFISVLSCFCTVFAEEKLTSDKFTLIVDIIRPEGTFKPSELRFNIFNENDEWLYNRCVQVNNPGRLTLEFPVPEYEIGAKFKLVATTGVEYVNYCDVNFSLGQSFVVETYAYRDGDGQLVVSDEAHVAACPLYTVNTWAGTAEDVVNGNRIWSDTDYLIWVSKSNYMVSVFLKEAGSWHCIKYFKCSIGAPSTPTVTGQYRYYQYQTRWQYNGYYVGPIMRFYGGYAIHSTLVNNNGTDRDGRVGKMISHGCVRVRPENINWLTSYVPLGTKIYITNN